MALDQREGKTFPPVGCTISEHISVSKEAQPDPVLRGPGDSIFSGGGLGRSHPLPGTVLKQLLELGCAKEPCRDRLTTFPARAASSTGCHSTTCAWDPARSQCLPVVTLGSCTGQSSPSLLPGHGWGVPLCMCMSGMVCRD